MKKYIECPKCGEKIVLPSDSAVELISENKEFLSQVLKRSADDLDEMSDEAKAERDRILAIIDYIESI